MYSIIKTEKGKTSNGYASVNDYSDRNFGEGRSLCFYSKSYQYYDNFYNYFEYYSK